MEQVMRNKGPLLAGCESGQVSFGGNKTPERCDFGRGNTRGSPRPCSLPPRHRLNLNLGARGCSEGGEGRGGQKEIKGIIFKDNSDLSPWPGRAGPGLASAVSQLVFLGFFSPLLGFFSAGQSIEHAF